MYKRIANKLTVLIFVLLVAGLFFACSSGGEQTCDSSYRPSILFMIRETIILEQTDIAIIESIYDANNGHRVRIRFTEEGSVRIYQETKYRIGQRLKIVLVEYDETHHILFEAFIDFAFPETIYIGGHWSGMSVEALEKLSYQLSRAFC